MEKKIKRNSEGAKSISYSSEEKTIIVTIVIALVIIGALLVNLVFFTVAETERFSVIYYLDSEKQLENIPKTVFLGENSTFVLWVGVENQNGTTLDYQVQMKIDDGNGQLNPSSTEHIQIFDTTSEPLKNGETWEFPVTIKIEQLGKNRIIFELYIVNGNSEVKYTGNWVNLSIEAI